MKSSLKARPHIERGKAKVGSEKEFLAIQMKRQKMQNEVLQISNAGANVTIARLRKSEDSFKKFYQLGVLYLFKNKDYDNAYKSMKK